MSVFYIFMHPFDYQTIYLINTSKSNSTSDSVDKLIHHIMEFILIMTPASLEPPASFSRVSGSEFA